MYSLWNFNKISIEVFNLCYQNLGSISLILFKPCAFRQRINFRNLQQFFHHNFQLKWKFWIFMVSSERYSSDLSKYTLFYKFWWFYRNYWLITDFIAIMVILCFMCRLENKFLFISRCECLELNRNQISIYMSASFGIIVRVKKGVFL